ncbi:MAG: polysulfide reductase NrfD [Ktedonobacterales bacterium]|nr:polysulfide reductase NrfD [Ktedonobacterales bacterium]
MRRRSQTILPDQNGHRAMSREQREPLGRLPGTTEPATYYGQPMIKRPTWKWPIPLYFFIGGVAGGAALIGGLADLLGGGRYRATVRHARWIALVGAMISPVLLIADLGRPTRFHYMLRVFKVASPLSVGTWILSAFGLTSGALAMKQAAEDSMLLRRESRLGRVARALPSRPLAVLHVLLGLGLGGYTGVLLAVTAVPLWAAAGLLLGPLFLATAVASGASLLALLATLHGQAGDADRAQVEQVATVATVTQLGLTVAREVMVPKTIARPLHSGLWGTIYRVSAVGAGMLGPLALRLPAQVRGHRVGRTLSATASTLALVGALAERFALVEAGKQSAADPLAYQELTKGAPGAARPLPGQQAQSAPASAPFQAGQVAPERTGP